MSNVRLNIGGREFSVACARGEEAHIGALGELIDDKLRTLGAAAGSSETRMLLFAALLLADEVHEARTGGQIPLPAPPAEDPAAVIRLCDGIEAAAARLEKLAAGLEQAAATA